MSILGQVRTYLGVLPKARRHRTDLVRWLRRRPQLLAATAGYELALLTSARMPSRLKTLAELKASTLITCEYCIDIGSALARHEGISEAQLRALPSYRTADRFTEAEVLVLELAEAMTRTPTEVPEELRARLLQRFTSAADSTRRSAFGPAASPTGRSARFPRCGRDREPPVAAPAGALELMRPLQSAGIGHGEPAYR